MTTEVDQIEERLRGPVNCWLNNLQQADFARLLVLARQSEGREAVPVRLYERSERPVAEADRIYNRPPILPSF